MKLNRKTKIGALVVAAGIAAAVAFGTAGNAAPFTPMGSATVKAAVTPPFTAGYQPNGSQVQCYDIRTGSATLHALFGPNGGVTTCPTGYYQHIVPAPIAGPKGDTGATGATGAAGAKGDTGAIGPAGTNGTNAQALPYGIALVNVSRGGATATTWGTFSTTIGSPVGDTASGVFRMSCSAAKAPCVISVQAYSTTSGVAVYPRLDISRQDTNNAPTGNCEYADGVDNNGSSIGVGNGVANVTNVPLGIGGTLDCNAGQTYPTDGIATSISVPAGFYDIDATFVFKK